MLLEFVVCDCVDIEHSAVYVMYVGTSCFVYGDLCSVFFDDIVNSLISMMGVFGQAPKGKSLLFVALPAYSRYGMTPVDQKDFPALLNPSRVNVFIFLRWQWSIAYSRIRNWSGSIYCSTH